MYIGGLSITPPPHLNDCTNSRWNSESLPCPYCIDLLYVCLFMMYRLLYRVYEARTLLIQCKMQLQRKFSLKYVKPSPWRRGATRILENHTFDWIKRRSRRRLQRSHWDVIGLTFRDYTHNKRSCGWTYASEQNRRARSRWRRRAAKRRKRKRRYKKERLKETRTSWDMTNTEKHIQCRPMCLP